MPKKAPNNFFSVLTKAVAERWQNRSMEKTWAIREQEIRNEIIEGIQELNVSTYLEAQTVNRAIEVVKGAIGISQ
jgi:hypothetical protein